jgi:hypothetical protein
MLLIVVRLLDDLVGVLGNPRPILRKTKLSGLSSGDWKNLAEFM